MDYIKERCEQLQQPVSTQVFVLEGGIKGWALAGPQYTQFMDVYVPSYWEQFNEQRQRPKRGGIDHDDEQGGNLTAKRTRESSIDFNAQQGVQATHSQDMSMTF